MRRHTLRRAHSSFNDSWRTLVGEHGLAPSEIIVLAAIAAILTYTVTNTTALGTINTADQLRYTAGAACFAAAAGIVAVMIQAILEQLRRNRDTSAARRD